MSDGLRERISGLITGLHDETTAWFAQLDGGGEFREDRWSRPGGGGGVSRVMSEGRTFEKAGINRSVVEGAMPGPMAQRLGAQTGGAEETRFFVTGMSLVAHPRSPMVPTVHLNVRYFEITDPDGAPLDRWFGGGTDLTPTWPHRDDPVHFHRTLAAMCARHHPGF